MNASPFPGEGRVGGKANRASLVQIAILSVLVFFLFQLFPCGLYAAEVEMQVSARETYVGVPINVQVTIKNAQNTEPPTVPDIPDVRVQSLGPAARSEQTYIVNGRITRSVSQTYVYLLTPAQPGSFTIPPITVKADGQPYQTEKVKIAVRKSDAGDLLMVEVISPRDSVYVGEDLQVTLQIWLKPFVDQQYGIRLSPDNMLNCIDFPGSQWGPFLEKLKGMSERHEPLQGREMLHPDSTGQKQLYYLYQVPATITAERPGKLALNDVSVLVNYPMKLERSERLLLMSDLTITARRPVLAKVQVQPVEVKALPLADRPPFFNGAVGRFDISASAKPTTVGVGEPITLTLTISGSGRLDSLRPPLLDKVPALVEGFRIPTDQLAGVIEGNTKRFTVSLRAINDRVREIPPITLAFFDPNLERYVTVQSAPIPLTVQPALALSPSAIVAAEGARPEPVSLSENAGGIKANYVGADLLADHSLAFSWTVPASLGVPPLAFLTLVLVLRRREYLLNHTGVLRARDAFRLATARLHAAQRGSGAKLPAAVLEAIAGYVADRSNLPTGGMTRAGVLEQARLRNVSPSLLGRLDALLTRCEEMQYSAQAEAAQQELLREAQAALAQLREEGL